MQYIGGTGATSTHPQFSPPHSYLQGTLNLTSAESVFESAELAFTAQLFPGGSRGRLQAWLYRKEPRNGAVSSQVGVDPSGGIPLSPSGDVSPMPGQAQPQRGPDPEPVLPAEPFAVESSDYVGFWPTALECTGAVSPLPQDARVLGRSLREVLDEFAGVPLSVGVTEGVDAAPQDQALQLQFEWPEGPLCQGLVGSGVLVDLMLRLTTDAGLDARIPVVAQVRTDRLTGQLDRLVIRNIAVRSRLSEAQLQDLLGTELPGEGDADGGADGGTAGDADGGLVCSPGEFQYGPDAVIAPGQPLLELRWGD